METNGDKEGGAGDGRPPQFLTRQMSCAKFGALQPNQLEDLSWMIHLVEKGFNGILAEEMGLAR